MLKKSAIAMAMGVLMLASDVYAEMAYFAHDGSLQTVASIGTGKQVGAGNTDKITSMGDRKFGEGWNIEFSGILELKKNETVEFTVGSDDGSALFVDGKVVIMNDGPHGVVTLSGKVKLTKGKHQVNLLYFNRSGGHGLTATAKVGAKGKVQDLATACSPSKERQDIKVVAKAAKSKTPAGTAAKAAGGKRAATQKPVADDPQALLAFSTPEALARSIKHILKTKSRQYKNGRDYLKQAEHFAEIMPETLEKLAAGDPEAAKTIKAFNDLKFAALVVDNPYMDFDEVIVVLTQKIAKKSNWLGTHVINPSGHNSEIARLNLRTGKITNIFKPEGSGYLGEPDLHFDADKLLFSSVDKNNRYQVMEVGVDGKGFRQVSTIDCEFVNNYGGVYLPNGKIVFSSTAPMIGVPCIGGKKSVPNLYLMDPDGGNTRQLTFEQDADWYPSVLPDGKIMFLRWEYTDIMHYYSRIMMTMNPDGTNQRAIYGSQSLWPNSMFYARPLPGEPGKYSAVVTGHHGMSGTGKLTIFDTNKGYAHADGVIQHIPGYGKDVTHVTVDQLYPTVKKDLLKKFPDLQEVVSGLIEQYMPDSADSGRDYHELNNDFFNKCYPRLRDHYPYDMALDLDRLADGVYPQFWQPYPVSAEYFLTSVQLSAKGDWGLYLVDKFDNFVPIKHDPDAGYKYAIEPQPLRKRKRPAIIPDRINPHDKEATCYIQNVYRGPGLEGVPEGVVDSLRVFTYAYGYYKTGSHYHLGVESGWDVKRILGTVKVEKDGSTMFKIPANTTISLQPLDKEGRAIQLFRSWLVAMPGEELSCIGCHESPAEPPVSAKTVASLKQPQRIVPRRGRVEGFSFNAEVQPVLDAHCARCHDGSDPRKPNFQDTKVDKPNAISANYSNAYYAFHKYFRRPGPESCGTMLVPYEYHASNSEGVQLLEKGHYGVNLDEEAWERLYTWIDMNVPYYGSWTTAYSGDAGRTEWTADISGRAAELRAQYANVNADWEYTPDKCYPVEAPTTKGARKSDPIDVSAKNWPFDEKTAQAMRKSQEKRSLDLGDGLTITMVRIPAGEFVMGSDGDTPQEQPRHKVRIKKAFWMSENEITNELFSAFNPDRNIGVFDQQWKDHVRLGYYSCYDEQPAVRLSWNDARAFCDWTAEKTNAKVALPTEAQWEWACRAGSDQEMAFGSRSADFSAFANLADKAIEKYAVRGVNPTFSAKNAGNPVYDYVPRIAEFDDKQFLVSGTKQYQPNAWGLYDMHGNVAEWTRSDYVGYPYQAKKSNSLDATTRKTVRGGSFRDRPYRATSSYRLGYAPWQDVFNVGFRIVVED